MQTPIFQLRTNSILPHAQFFDAKINSRATLPKKYSVTTAFTNQSESPFDLK